MPFRSHARDGHDIFEILVRENADMLTAFLHSSLHDPSDVDDLFQETMVVAWRRIDDYDRSLPFGPWLRGIARNLILAHYRKHAAAPQWCTPELLEGIDRRFEALSAKAGDSFRDRIETLLDCVRKLSDRLRDVIEMTYSRGMNHREIALATNEQESTIRKRAQRAREALHDCLMAGGVER